MFITGYYYKTIKRTPIEETCLQCDADSSQYLDVICKINHYYYIPFIPTKKQLVRKCDICGATYHVEQSEFNEKLLKSTRYPKRYYIGLIPAFIFLILIINVPIKGYYSNKEIKQSMIHNVKKGYTIFQKMDNGYKTCMLIVDIRGDSVFVKENSKKTKGDIYQINELKYFKEDLNLYTLEELQQMIDDDYIYDIEPTTVMLDTIDLWNDYTK